MTLFLQLHFILLFVNLRVHYFVLLVVQGWQNTFKQRFKWYEGINICICPNKVTINWDCLIQATHIYWLSVSKYRVKWERWIKFLLWWIWSIAWLIKWMWPVLRNEIFESSLPSFGAELFPKWSFFEVKHLFSSVSPIKNITATLYQSHCVINIFFLIFFKRLCIIHAWPLLCSIQIYVSQHILHILLKN